MSPVLKTMLGAWWVLTKHPGTDRQADKGISAGKGINISTRGEKQGSLCSRAIENFPLTDSRRDGSILGFHVTK